MLLQNSQKMFVVLLECSFVSFTAQAWMNMDDRDAGFWFGLGWVRLLFLPKCLI